MENRQIKKLEEIEELLSQLQKNFVSTYKEVHRIMDEMKEEADMEEAVEGSLEDELDADLMNHMDEIFGGDDE